MSYSKFKEEMFDEMEKEHQANSKKFYKKSVNKRIDEATRIVVRRWLKQGMFKELVAWAVSNFDTICGDNYIWNISDELLKRKEAKNLRRLWRGIISNRLRHFGEPVSDKEKQSRKRKNDRNKVIAAIMEYIRVMKKLGEKQEVDYFTETLQIFKEGKKRKKTSSPDKRKMTEDLFWQLIDESRKETESCSEQIESLIEKLEQFNATQIKKFQKILFENLARLNHWDIWALAYIARNGCSDDEFDYFRAWVISQGKKVFDFALKDVNKAAKFIGDEDQQCEGLLYAAEEAYENKSDSSLTIGSTKVKIKGQEWNEDNLKQRYPELCKRFGFS